MVIIIIILCIIRKQYQYIFSFKCLCIYSIFPFPSYHPRLGLLTLQSYCNSPLIFANSILYFLSLPSSPSLN